MKSKQVALISLMVSVLFTLSACMSPTTSTPDTSFMNKCGGGTIVANDGSKFVVMDASGQIIKSVPAKGFIVASTYSPDGRFLIYSNMTYGLFLLDMESGEKKQLDFGIGGFPSHPALSYDGKQLAFASGIPAENGYTYIVNLDNLSSPIALPRADDSDFELPESWRENGDLLLSVSGDIHKPYPIGKVNFSKLVIVNTISGSRKTIYTSNSFSIESQWSPNSDWIVATESDPPFTFLLNLEDNSRKNLEKISSNSRNAIWSPNGMCIAFLNPSNYIQIYSLDTDEIFSFSDVSGYHAITWKK